MRRRSVVRFWLWRSATGNSADRSRHLSTNVVTPSLKRTDDLRSDPSGEARELFNLGLVHALKYGVASADLKPSIPWARSRFLEHKRLRLERQFCRPPERSRRGEEGPTGAGSPSEVCCREPRCRRGGWHGTRSRWLAMPASLSEEPPSWPLRLR